MLVVEGTAPGLGPGAEAAAEVLSIVMREVIFEFCSAFGCTLMRTEANSGRCLLPSRLEEASGPIGIPATRLLVLVLLVLLLLVIALLADMRMVLLPLLPVLVKGGGGGGGIRGRDTTDGDATTPTAAAEPSTATVATSGDLETDAKAPERVMLWLAGDGGSQSRIRCFDGYDSHSL